MLGRRVGAIPWRAAIGLTVGLMLAIPVAAAENLGIFEIRVDGKVVKRWDRAQVRKLPPAEFTNRAGKKRTAVLLSTLLEQSGTPMGRVAGVTVTGLGGDTKKGPSTKGIQAEKGTGQTRREFKGEEVGSVLARTVLFYNPDGHWTLADSQRPEPQAPWDQNRVRRVRRIDVVLNRP